jgi:hypothetical protein
MKVDWAGWKRVGIATLVGVCLCLAPYGCGATKALPPLTTSENPVGGNVPKLPGAIPPISSGLNTLDWIVGVSFLGAFLCIIATVAVGSLFGLGSATLRRLAATFVCTGVGALILKAFGVAIADWTSRYTWIVGVLALVVGIAAAALFTWGHVNWLERKLNIDLDRDGDIGVE